MNGNTSTSESVNSAPKCGLIDLGQLEELRDVLADGFADLIDDFLASSGETVAAMTSAVAAGEGEIARKAAHSLKGSSRNVGASSLADLCQTLEELCNEARVVSLDSGGFATVLAALQSCHVDTGAALRRQTRERAPHPVH